MMHKAWSNTEEVPGYLSKSSLKFQFQRDKKRRFLHELGDSGLLLELVVTDDCEVMHKARSRPEEVKTKSPEK